MEDKLYQTAILDLFLKVKKGHQYLLDIDRLIVINGDAKEVSIFKMAATDLTEVNESVMDTQQEAWKEMLKKQVRESINRVKNKKPKGT